MRYLKLHAASTTASSCTPQPTKPKRTLSGRLRELSDDEDEGFETSPQSLDPKFPWRTEFNDYINTREGIPVDMRTIQWWGVRFNGSIFYAGG